jgi:creatinine amidohydrolase
MERHIERLTYIEIGKLISKGNDIVILPVGTVEAHGPHLPLGTDVMIPCKIAEKLAEVVDGLIAPPIYYGITRSLVGYTGSLTVPPDTFTQYVKAILLSLAKHGFKKAIVINGHGGHVNELKDIATEVWSESKLMTVMFHWWIALEQYTKDFFKEQGGHAAVDETAMMLAIDESLVKEKLYSEDASATLMQGVDVFPFYGPVILYKRGEGFPEFDTSKSAQYFEGVISHTIEIIKEILAKWKSNLR